MSTSDKNMRNISSKIREEELNLQYRVVSRVTSNGAIEIPNLPKIPDVDVTVNTRKGVNVKYAPKLSA